MTPATFYNIYLVFLAATLVAGMFRYRYFSRRISVVFYLVCFSAISEVVSTVCGYFLETKAPIYHFTCLISLFIISVYFIKTIFQVHKNKYFYISGLSILGIGIVNLFFQGLLSLNTNTLILRGFLVILMALYALYQMLINDNILEPQRNPDFYIWVSLLILYGGTYFFWSYIKILSNDGYGKYQDLAKYIQMTINIFAYSTIGFIFLIYPRKFLK